jgi:hypothetical protein
MVILGQTIKEPAFHLALEECSARWFVQGAVKVPSLVLAN